MMYYDQTALDSLKIWQKKMLGRPSVMSRMTKGVQEKINKVIPEKIHKAITGAIKQMVRAVLFGAMHTTSKLERGLLLRDVETKVNSRIEFYKNTAAAEGGITGATGFVGSLADFPILLGLKMKMLFDIIFI